MLGAGGAEPVGVAPVGERVRLAEVLGVLSLATDVAMGQPMEHGLRTCLVAEGLAARAGFSTAEAHDVYELALLRWVGCTAHAHELAGWFDDEIAAHRRSATFDLAGPRDVVADLLRHAGAGRPPLDRARTLAGALARGPRAVHDLFASSCEVAGRLAERFGSGEPVRDGLAHVFARWDGRGWPPVRGEAVSRLARVVHVAQDAAVFHRLSGTAAASDVVRRRAGHAYDPAVADVFLAAAGEILEATEQPSLWGAMLAAEPGRRRYLAGEEVGAALEAVADFADLKSPWTAGHSRGVARLAEAAAPALGESPVALRSSALVHDLGRVGVPNGVWDRPGSLDSGEWEQVRLHPYLTERMLARSEALRPLAEAASRHHERLDGSGYHRGAGGASLPTAARLLAACDAYEGATRARPHRPALTPPAAASHLRAEAAAGRLDAAAVAAALAAAGEGASLGRPALPAGLTAREVEVLRLLARGLTLKDVAAALAISAKTAGHHAEHIYTKLGVGSRAAAALAAVELGLL